MAHLPIDMTSNRGWQMIEAYLPSDLEALAKETKVLEVQYGEAKITSGRELLRMILLHAGADLGLRQTVTLAAEAGAPKVSHVTLHKKMRLSGAFLGALVKRLTAGEQAAAENWAGYEVIGVDGSSFCGPGADGTDARVHIQLRLSDLELVSATMTGRAVGESFKRFEWRKGQLAVADRGLCNPPGIGHVVNQGGDVLVRVNRAALPMHTQSGEPIELMNWLRSLPGQKACERAVVVHDREHELLIRGRLIAIRLPPAQAEKARARLRREFGNETTALDMEAAQYVVLFTTVPASRMPAEMCLELYRLRWQVELAFKRWKSLCHFDHLPNYRDDTILSWLYAKLLLALLLHRMVAGASTLFPPESQSETEDTLALDALEGHDYRLARPRCRVAAA